MSQATSITARAAEFRLHPLGFFYLLDRHEDGVTRRVHVWPAEGTDVPENDRHQHSFDIHSRVLLGRMRSELFRFSELSGGGEREFKVTYEEGRSTLSATGRAGMLIGIATFESSAGNSYFLQAGVIHRVTVIQRPCVTSLSTVERGIPIYSYGNDAGEPPFDRRQVNAREAEEIRRTLGLVTSSYSTGSPSG